MKTLTRTFIAMAVTAAFAGSALAENSNCTKVPMAQWMSKSAVKAKAAAMGYKVRSIRREGTCYEAKALYKGNRREVVFNPANGQLVDRNEQN